MKRVSIDDVEHPPTISQASVVRPLSRPLELTDVAVNYFELEPGDAFGFDYHRHRDQEEVFYVQAGTATFRTADGDVRKSGAPSSQPEPRRGSGDVEVHAGEVVRFAPGEFQLGRNIGEERVRALAIGAPGDSTEIEYLRACGPCGEETLQTPEVDREAMVFEIRCEACGSVVDRIEFDE